MINSTERIKIIIELLNIWFVMSSSIFIRMSPCVWQFLDQFSDRFRQILRRLIQFSIDLEWIGLITVYIWCTEHTHSIYNQMMLPINLSVKIDRRCLHDKVKKAGAWDCECALEWSWSHTASTWWYSVGVIKHMWFFGCLSSVTSQNYPRAVVCAICATLNHIWNLFHHKLQVN